MTDWEADKRAREDAPPPIEALGTEATADGTVKLWRDEKGHGIIACPQVAPFDIWCHFSHIEMDGFKKLDVGQRVIVDFVRADQESFRYVARRVRLK